MHPCIHFFQARGGYFARAFFGLETASRHPFIAARWLIRMGFGQGRNIVLYMTVEGAAGGGGGKQLWTMSNDGLGMKKTISYGDGIAG